MEEEQLNNKIAKSATIILNGDLPNEHKLQSIIASTDITICTDGAADKIYKSNIKLDLIIGDFDSISDQAINRYKENVKIVKIEDQYSTDFEKALDYCICNKYHNISLVGFYGGRFDHSLTNISIIKYYSSNLRFDLFEKTGFGVVLSDNRSNFVAATKINNFVSLIPLSTVTGVKTHGLLYPLNSEVLEFGGRVGQSNLTTSERFEINIETGMLIVFLPTS